MDQAPIPPHVVLLSSPGMGHIIPLASLAVCLTRHHGLSVTLISNTISSNQQSLQDFLSFNQVKLIKLEEPNEPSPSSSNFKAESRIWQTIKSTMPHVHSKIKSIAKESHLSAIIFDPFYLDALDTAKELNIPCFLFFTTSCMALSFTFSLPGLDKQCQDQFCDLPEPIQLLGCVPI
ncbi:Glycosyltransferase [Rhynchospora pubera]|uniref:Glycosyltransferase n=1 Tax=Rhynchospora pubera TaxID=906938 RepID=A0AAV8EL72_9POAL|nr:Glycosyltransferase [Rhynchospora pubera]